MNPFQQTDNGNYRVVQPADGMTPDEMSVTVGNRRYHLYDYAGKDHESRIAPDVLVYREMEEIVISDEMPSSSSSDDDEEVIID
jgi:hypothetical protein